MKQLLRTLILFCVRIIGLPRAYAAAKKAQTLPIAAPRILLIRPDHLGDLVLTTPVFDALKTHLPDAHITMLVGPWSSEVVARHPAIDTLRTCAFPGFQRAPQSFLAPYILLFSTARQLQRGNYDLAINLRPDFWWGAALLYLACIPRRIGYALKPGQAFLSHAIPFDAPEHATISNLRLVSTALESLGHPPLEQPYTPERYPLQFTPTATERQEIGNRLTQAGIAPSDPIVVIHPGTGGPVKLWRNEAWAHIASTLSEKLTLPSPVRIMLTGSPKERLMLEEIAQHMTTRPTIFTDLTVGQLAALLHGAMLVLGVDNGPLHLAVAQGTPTLQLFGPTDPRIFGPWGDTQRHPVIASTYRCPTCPAIPCNRLDFSPEELPAHPCVKRITEQQVLGTINQLLHTTEQTQPS